MPKKKQLTFQSSIPGRFIPRNPSSSLSVYPTGANDNRLNARMAELLASSSSMAVVDDGKNLSPLRSSEDMPSNDSSRLPAKSLHRRIVNMLDAFREPTEEPTRASSDPSWKSQPITFGQLRQATISSQSPASSVRLSRDERSDRHGRLLVRDNHSDVTSRTSNSLNQSSADSRITDAPSLSVEEILAKYYPTNEVETSGAFFIHPSTARLIGDEQSQRPPPPSYSSSLAKKHRSDLSSEQSSVRYGMETSSTIPQRPPPPRYRSPSSSVDRSHSTISPAENLARVNPPSDTTSNRQQNLPKGFDRQFSRLLYGKDRRVKQKRKSFSDPVRKCIEEARRANERSTRRVTTTQEQTSDTDKDEQDNEAERSNTQSRVFTPVTRRRLARSINSIEKNFDSTRRNLVPAPSALKRRIPSFLRVYSRASPSNDVLLQWHLFHLSELEAFCAMMSRLYKNENLARVQFYEIYRSALLDTLASKRSLDVGPALN